MSCIYELNDESRENLGKLESWLAEEVLDELELLVLLKYEEKTAGGFVYDFVRERDGRKHYLFLTIVPDIARRQLRVTTLGSFSRPIESQ